ncbi:hypothetical protein ACS0TY_022961 [Phlomoides rotata]
MDVFGHALEADLYVLDMKDFDIVRGKDWLSKYRAGIQCLVIGSILLTPSDKETTFYGVESRTVPHVISNMKEIDDVEEE